ncbi:Rab3 GTPase-activating protein catalytic subunit [Thoreauomyces humboldtii]|nr:Rab3 GTPase-activating protein catalytic subunit [Thoreauomyces humboldtii]
MAEEDNEFFELVDYTSASPLERFISNIESLLTDWQIDPIRASDPAHLVYADTEYTLQRHAATGSHGEVPDHGFPLRSASSLPLHRWTGLRVLMTLVPRHQTQRTSLDVSTTKLLLSAFLIAAGNTRCTTPAFVPTGPGWKAMWTGVGIDPAGGETRWRMIHAPYVPPQWGELTGLRQLVATKMTLEPDSMDVAILLSYELQIDEEDIEWREYAASSAMAVSTTEATEAETSDEESPTGSQGSEVIMIPYGPTANPIQAVVLEAVFPRNNVRNVTYPLELDTSPEWRLNLERKADIGQGLLASTLDRITDAWTETMYGGPVDAEGHAPDGEDAPTGASWDSAEAHRADTGGPVEDSDIEEALSALLDLPTNAAASGPPSFNGISVKPFPSVQALSAGYRSPHLFPRHSLLDQLVLRVLDWNSPESALRFREASLHNTLGALWSRLVAEFYECWELGNLLPGVFTAAESTEHVELRWSLLYQKLQMLNYCIRRRRERGEQRERRIVQPEMPDAAITAVVNEPSEPTVPSLAPHETSVFSLSKRVLSTLNDVSASVVKADSSTLPNLFARLSSSATSGIAAKPPPSPSDSRPPLTARSPPDRPPLEATSWSSDRSWENIKARRDSTSTSFIIGSLGARSNGSSDDLSHTPRVDAPHPSLGSLAAHKENADDEHQDVFFDTMEDAPGPFQGLPSTASNTQPASLTESFIHLPLTTRTGHTPILLPFRAHATNTPLYLPVTQTPGPHTEDEIQHIEKVLTGLDSTARARFQSAGLESDMRAFKAANPGAGLEDFVRWWSPRDWIEETDEHLGGVLDHDASEREAQNGGGRLSARMVEPGNLWVELWTAAPAIAAAEQSPLFDHTHTAETVLAYLAALPLHQLLTFMIPQALIHAYGTLSNAPHSSAEGSRLSTLAQAISQLDRPSHPTPHAPQLARVVENIAETELALAVDSAVARLLPTGSTLASRMLADGTSCTVLATDDPHRADVVGIFRKTPAPYRINARLESVPDTQYFPAPASREYVFAPSTSGVSIGDDEDDGPSRLLKLHVPRSTNSPHRVYAILRGGEFRVVECVSTT